MNLNIIIKDLLKEHPEGGEKFFDALDLLIRGDSDILSMFLDFVMNNLSENITYGVVLSGKFGCVLYNNYGHILSKYFDGGIILTNGVSVKENQPIQELQNFHVLIMYFQMILIILEKLNLEQKKH